MEARISAWSATRAHLPALVALGRTYYPPEHPALWEDFLRWLYLENPAGAATLVVAHEGDFWVGVIALVPVTLEGNGRMQSACYAVNVLTHPERRGRNLFGRMIAHARECLAKRGMWLLGHPNASAAPGWQRQQMQFREPLRLYLAKFGGPFSGRSAKRITDVRALLDIAPEFWGSLAKRSDMHPRYSPEFIAWRYLRAPHRDYAVTAIENRGRLLGLRVTRPVRWPVDLMVDFIGPHGELGEVVAGVRRPTLLMHSGLGDAASDVKRGCWSTPSRRRIPFFVSTWDEARADMSGITLAASDF